MYILLHAKAPSAGEYRFEVSVQIGERHTTRYGKAFITNCHSARSAMSYANGVVAGWAECSGHSHSDIQVIRTEAFETEFQKETAE